MCHLRTPWAARAAIMFCLWLLPSGIANAEEGQPTLGVKVALSDTPYTGAGVSALFRLTPADPDSRALPPIQTLRLIGDIGSVDLDGIPTCEPTRSVRSSGCTAPLIGSGQSVAYQSPSPQSEGDPTLKLHGTVRLYSGGQRGGISKLYAWAHFPDAGAHETGRSYVIPITIRRGRADGANSGRPSHGRKGTCSPLLNCFCRFTRESVSMVGRCR